MRTENRNPKIERETEKILSTTTAMNVDVISHFQLICMQSVMSMRSEIKAACRHRTRTHASLDHRQWCRRAPRFTNIIHEIDWCQFSSVFFFSSIFNEISCRRFRKHQRIFCTFFFARIENRIRREAKQNDQNENHEIVINRQINVKIGTTFCQMRQPSRRHRCRRWWRSNVCALVYRLRSESFWWCHQIFTASCATVCSHTNENIRFRIWSVAVAVAATAASIECQFSVCDLFIVDFNRCFDRRMCARAHSVHWVFNPRRIHSIARKLYWIDAIEFHRPITQFGGKLLTK